MTFQCDECGKTLATEGGFEIHRQSHGPAPAPLTLASIPEPTQPLTPLELPAVTPSPKQPRPPRAPRPPRTARPRPALAVPGQPAMLVMGLAVASAVMFLVGMTAAVNPSLIRNTKKVTAATATTTGSSSSHSVPIPKASDPATTPTTAATTPSTTRVTTPQVSDDTRAQSLTLQLADFGPGWATDASSSSPFAGIGSPDTLQGDTTNCEGVASTPDPLATATGPGVYSGDLAAFTAGAVFATKADAEATLAALKDPKALACIKTDFLAGVHSAGGAAATATATVERFSLALGSVSNSGLRFVVKATGPGGTGTVVMDMLMVQAGRAESVAMFMSVGSRMPSSIEQALAHRMAQKDLAVEQVAA